METYSVFPIESPVSPSQLASYRTLRLTSLQIDPQAFSSSYAREEAFPEDVWRERLGSRLKRTFVASVEERNEKGDIDDARAEEKGEWIGMAGIASAAGIPNSIQDLFKEAGMGANWEMYAVYGMWVHPAHRSKGIGALLVKACLEWARMSVDVKVSSDTGGSSEKVVVLLVYDGNIAGRAFYSKMGFIDVEGVSAGEGQRWMLARV